MHGMQVYMVNITSGVLVKPHPMPKSHTFLWRKRSIMGLYRSCADGHLTPNYYKYPLKVLSFAHFVQVVPSSKND